MSIIIRLQNLPWAANALDIRQFFSGLQIPEGGVHIVGGELGDAFIAFSTDEDARQAFLRTDGRIKGIQVKLMLSSRTEMQRVIEQARSQSMAAFMLPTTQPAQPAVPPLPAAVPQVMPAAVPEIKTAEVKERDDPHSDKKRERRRSRSRSRDRRDRSRDRRERRYRDRSRSKSRDRRDRRRGRRSKSRNRSRDRDSRSSRRERARSSEKRDDKDLLNPYQRDTKKPVPEVWNTRPQVAPHGLGILQPAAVPNEAQGILGASPWNLNAAVKTNLVAAQNLNGFQPVVTTPTRTSANVPNPSLARSRESWPPANPPSVRENIRSSPTDYPTPPVLGGIGRDDVHISRDDMNFPRRDNIRNMRDQIIDLRDDDTRSPRDDLRGMKADMRGPRDFRDDKRGNRMFPFPNDDLRLDLNSRITNNGRENVKRSRFDDIDTPVNACVAIEPFYGSYGDLRRFFYGLSINYRGIKVINDEFGHKTGVCFIQFRDASSKNGALKMNGCSLNNTEVKIRSITDKMFEEAIDRYNPRMDDLNPHEDHLGRTRNIKKFLSDEPEINDFVCLKVEDLPTFVKEQDILHIFSQHPLLSLHLNFKPKGGTVAYVKFGSKEVARLALEEKSHHVIRGKPVTVKPCSNEEFNQINKPLVEAIEEPKLNNIDTDCVSVSKLPLKITDRDISDIFSDIGLVPTKIHLASDNAGLTRQAYCEFATKEDALKALTKHNTLLCQNTITVELILRSEMEALLNNSLAQPQEAVVPKEGIPSSSVKKETLLVVPEPKIAEEPATQLDVTLSKEASKPEEKVEEPDQKGVEQEAPSIESEKEEPPRTKRNRDPSKRRRFEGISQLNKIEHGKFNSSSHFDGPRNFNISRNFDGPLNFEGPLDFERPLDFEGPRNFGGGPRGFDDLRDFDGAHNFGFDGPRGFGRNFDRSSRDYDGQLRGFDGRGDFDDDSRDFFEGPRGSYGSRGNFGPLEDFEPRGGHRGARFGPRGGSRFNLRRNESPVDDERPGCTVFMDNVPYKAGTNEIIEFFDGYNCTNNVSRRYNPNNTPSPEAKVTFYNPDDAFRAVRELHGKKIWGRSIFLKQQ